MAVERDDFAGIGKLVHGPLPFWLRGAPKLQIFEAVVVADAVDVVDILAFDQWATDVLSHYVAMLCGSDIFPVLVSDKANHVSIRVRLPLRPFVNQRLRFSS